MSHRPANAETDALLDEALEIFQPRTSRRLSREDAREIYVNLTGFFRVLQDWERVEREKIAREGTSAPGDGGVVAPGTHHRRRAS